MTKVEYVHAPGAAVGSAFMVSDGDGQIIVAVLTDGRGEDDTDARQAAERISSSIVAGPDLSKPREQVIFLATDHHGVTTSTSLARADEFDFSTMDDREFAVLQGLVRLSYDRVMVEASERPIRRAHHRIAQERENAALREQWASAPLPGEEFLRRAKAAERAEWKLRSNEGGA